MRTLLIIACMAGASTAFSYELTEGPLRAEALELLRASGEIRSMTMALPAEKKQVMLEYVRLQQSRDVAKDFEYTRVLLHLGDEATYQDLLKKKDFGSLHGTLDPHAFELIASEMFGDDPPRWNAMGIPVYTDPELARQSIGTMLRRMPESPPHIKVWIDTFINADVSQRELQQIFRDWWTANEDAWRRRDFAALKAGPDMSHRNIPKMRAAQRAKEAAAAAAAGSSANTLPETPPPPAPIPSSESPRYIWLRAAVLGTLIFCCALGIGAWQVARKARR